jgi:hypothetical protein
MNVGMQDFSDGGRGSEFGGVAARAAAFFRRVAPEGGGRLRPLIGASNSLRAMAAALIAAFLVAAGITAAWEWSKLAGWSAALWPSLPQGAIVAPSSAKNFEWIARAIRECEAEAARKAGTLYFLVIPVLAADGNFQQWTDKSNGTIGDSVLLVGSEATLDALKNGSLALYRDRFNFAIGEVTTRKVYRWKPAVGVTKFAVRNADVIQAFKPGFQTASAAKTDWADGGPITREAGTCYWTGALMRS